jgi:hypothetical protein
VVGCGFGEMLGVVLGSGGVVRLWVVFRLGVVFGLGVLLDDLVSLWAMLRLRVLLDDGSVFLVVNLWLFDSWVQVVSVLFHSMDAGCREAAGGRGRVLLACVVVDVVMDHSCSGFGGGVVGVLRYLDGLGGEVRVVLGGVGVGHGF